MRNKVLDISYSRNQYFTAPKISLYALYCCRVPRILDCILGNSHVIWNICVQYTHIHPSIWHTFFPPFRKVLHFTCKLITSQASTCKTLRLLSLMRLKPVFMVKHILTQAPKEAEFYCRLVFLSANMLFSYNQIWMSWENQGLCSQSLLMSWSIQCFNA